MRDIPGEEGIFGSASGHENGMGIDLTGGVIFMPGHQSLSERLELRRIGRCPATTHYWNQFKSPKMTNQAAFFTIETVTGVARAKYHGVLPSCLHCRGVVSYSHKGG